MIEELKTRKARPPVAPRRLDTEGGSSAAGDMPTKPGATIRMMAPDEVVLREFIHAHNLGGTDENGRVVMSAFPNTQDVTLLRHIGGQRDQLRAQHYRFIKEHDEVLLEATGFTADRVRVAGQETMAMLVPKEDVPRLLQGIWDGTGEAEEAASRFMQRSFEREADFWEATTQDRPRHRYRPMMAAAPPPRGNNPQTGTVRVTLQPSDPFMDRVVRLWNATLARNQDGPMSFWSRDGTFPTEMAEQAGHVEGAINQPPPWVYGLDGRNFSVMYRKRVAWSKMFCASNVREHMSSTVPNAIPQDDEEWDRMMQEDMPRRMRMEGLREWFEDDIDNPEAWDLLWELVRMRKCKGSMWDNDGNPTVGTWVTWQILGAISILCGLTVRYTGVGRKRDAMCTEFLLDRSVMGGIGNKPLLEPRAAKKAGEVLGTPIPFLCDFDLYMHPEDTPECFRDIAEYRNGFEVYKDRAQVHFTVNQGLRLNGTERHTTLLLDIWLMLQPRVAMHSNRLCYRPCYLDGVNGMGILEEHYGINTHTGRPFAEPYTGVIDPSDKMPWGLSIRGDPRPACHEEHGGRFAYRMIRNSPTREVLDLITNPEWCRGSNNNEVTAVPGEHPNRPDLHAPAEGRVGEYPALNRTVRDRAPYITEYFQQGHLAMRPWGDCPEQDVMGRRLGPPVPDDHRNGGLYPVLNAHHDVAEAEARQRSEGTEADEEMGSHDQIEVSSGDDKTPDTDESMGRSPEPSDALAVGRVQAQLSDTMVEMTSIETRETVRQLIRLHSPRSWKERIQTEGIPGVEEDRAQMQVRITRALRREVLEYTRKVSLRVMHDPKYSTTHAEGFRVAPDDAMWLLAADYRYIAAKERRAHQDEGRRVTVNAVTVLRENITEKAATEYCVVDIRHRCRMQEQGTGVTAEDDVQPIKVIPAAQRRILNIIEEHYIEALGYDDDTMAALSEVPEATRYGQTLRRLIHMDVTQTYEMYRTVMDHTGLDENGDLRALMWGGGDMPREALRRHTRFLFEGDECRMWVPFGKERRPNPPGRMSSFEIQDRHEHSKLAHHAGMIGNRLRKRFAKILPISTTEECFTGHDEQVKEAAEEKHKIDGMTDVYWTIAMPFCDMDDEVWTVGARSMDDRGHTGDLSRSLVNVGQERTKEKISGCAHEPGYMMTELMKMVSRHDALCKAFPDGDTIRTWLLGLARSIVAQHSTVSYAPTKAFQVLNHNTIGMFPYECRNIMQAAGIEAPYFHDCRFGEEGTMYEHNGRSLYSRHELLKLHSANHLLLLHSVGVINSDPQNLASSEREMPLFMDRVKLPDKAAGMKMISEIESFLISAVNEMNTEFGEFNIIDEVVARRAAGLKPPPMLHRAELMILCAMTIHEAAEVRVRHAIWEQGIRPMDKAVLIEMGLDLAERDGRCDVKTFDSFVSRVEQMIMTNEDYIRRVMSFLVRIPKPNQRLRIGMAQVSTHLRRLDEAARGRRDRKGAQQREKVVLKSFREVQAARKRTFSDDGQEERYDKYRTSEDRGKGGTERSAGSQARSDDGTTGLSAERQFLDPPRYSLDQWISYWWYHTHEDPRGKFNSHACVDDFDHLTEAQAARIVHDVQDARVFMKECHDHWVYIEMVIERECTGARDARCDLDIKRRVIEMFPTFPERLETKRHYEVPATSEGIRRNVLTGQGLEEIREFIYLLTHDCTHVQMGRARKAIANRLRDTQEQEIRKIRAMELKWFGQGLRAESERSVRRVQDIVREYHGYDKIGPI